MVIFTVVIQYNINKICIVLALCIWLLQENKNGNDGESFEVFQFHLHNRRFHLQAFAMPK